MKNEEETIYKVVFDFDHNEEGHIEDLIRHVEHVSLDFNNDISIEIVTYGDL